MLQEFQSHKICYNKKLTDNTYAKDNLVRLQHESNLH
jgi:hypothetical protein